MLCYGQRGDKVSISAEFTVSLIVQVVILAFFAGIYVATIKFICKQIDELKTQSKDDKEELKEEMRRYNNILSRMAVAENSIASAHKRIDDIVEKKR